ncbi:hypothetical protein [Paenibacillus sp. NPDC058071]|uniref:hypothetical protein n=1 Tax=Paenibacillus sp. NPDC058071 TaxID=3346326 RepID=UPI0036D83A9E
MLWIDPPYEKDKVSIVSITAKVEKQARFIRQSGSEHYALIEFVIEPCQGHIGFNNEAIIQEDLRGNKEWEQRFPLLICRIYDSLKQFIHNQYDEKNQAVGNFIFTLTSLDINPFDSRIMDYGIATHIGLREIFENKSNERG